MPTPLEAREERLHLLNQLLLPLLRASRGYARAWSLVEGLEKKPARLEASRDYSTGLLVLDLPGSHPLVVAVAASAQHSRPLAPSQLERRLQRLRRLVARARGKLFTAADVVYVILAPRGYTRGATRLARTAGVIAARTPREAASRLARYLKQRLTALHARLRGRRVWGPVPLLYHALAALAQALGADIKAPGTTETVRLALDGGQLPPPTQTAT